MEGENEQQQTVFRMSRSQLEKVDKSINGHGKLGNA